MSDVVPVVPAPVGLGLYHKIPALASPGSSHIQHHASWSGVDTVCSMGTRVGAIGSIVLNQPEWTFDPVYGGGKT